MSEVFVVDGQKQQNIRIRYKFVGFIVYSRLFSHLMYRDPDLILVQLILQPEVKLQLRRLGQLIAGGGEPIG